jgi:hypothetical protein
VFGSQKAMADMLSGVAGFLAGYQALVEVLELIHQMGRDICQ